LETLATNIYNSLYHYTTEYSLLAIIESRLLRPSLTKPNGRDILLGEGQYFTDIAPETIACRSRTEMTPMQIESGQLSLFQLGNRIMSGTPSPEKLDCFIEVDVANLIIIHSSQYEYIYFHESKIDLDISNRIIRSGKTLI
jgi:HYD1 signature containing ADP-ribosyltransferase